MMLHASRAARATIRVVLFGFHWNTWTLPDDAFGEGGLGMPTGTDHSGNDILPQHPIVSDPDGARDVKMTRTRLIGHSAPYMEGSINEIGRGWVERYAEKERPPLFAIYDDREGNELSDGSWHSPQKAFIEYRERELEELLLTPYRRDLLVFVPASAFDELGDPRDDEVEEAIEELSSTCLPLYDATGVVLDGFKYPQAAFMPGDVSLTIGDERYGESDMFTLERPQDGGTPLYKSIVFGMMMSKLSSIARSRLHDMPDEKNPRIRNLSVRHLSAMCQLFSLGNLPPFKDVWEDMGENHASWNPYRPDWGRKSTRLEACLAPGDPFLYSNLAAAETAATVFEPLIEVWSACAQGVMSLDYPMAEEPIPSRMQIYAQFAEAIGARPLIGAVCSGVALDDILGIGDDFLPAWRVSQHQLSPSLQST